MPAHPKHKGPIIDTAVMLFRRRGYSATGLNEIVEVSGAPKGSLYHYFPGGKPSIAVAAVEEAGRRFAPSLEELFASTASTADLIRSHGRQLAGWMRKSGFRDGCPITTVILELAPEDRAICDAGRRAYAARTDVFRRKLLQDGYAEQAAERLAMLCTATLQGALIQSRVDRSGRPIETAADELARLIGTATSNS